MSVPSIEAVLSKVMGCRQGEVVEGYGAVCDSGAHDHAMWHTGSGCCDFALALAEVIRAEALPALLAEAKAEALREAAKAYYHSDSDVWADLSERADRIAGGDA